MSKTYKVHIKNAIVGSSFTFFFDDYPGYTPRGIITEETFDLEIPEEYSGKGKVKIFGRLPSRSTQFFAFSIPFNLSSGSKNTLIFTKATRSEDQVPKEEPSIKALLKNHKNPQVITNAKETPTKEVSASEKTAVEAIKEAADNDLRDDALDAIKTATDNKLREKIEEKKTGNSFWDKIK